MAPSGMSALSVCRMVLLRSLARQRATQGNHARDHERERDDRDDAEERSEEHTSELQSRLHLVCRLLLEKKKMHTPPITCTRQLSGARQDTPLPVPHPTPRRCFPSAHPDRLPIWEIHLQPFRRRLPYTPV